MSQTATQEEHSSATSEDGEAEAEAKAEVDLDGDDLGPGGSTSSHTQRYWLTNDLGYIWVLSCYMTVWAILRLAPILLDADAPVSWEMDAGALLALASAITWGFGVDAMAEYKHLKGSD